MFVSIYPSFFYFLLVFSIEIDIFNRIDIASLTIQSLYLSSQLPREFFGNMLTTLARKVDRPENQLGNLQTFTFPPLLQTPPVNLMSNSVVNLLCAPYATHNGTKLIQISQLSFHSPQHPSSSPFFSDYLHPCQFPIPRNILKIEQPVITQTRISEALTIWQAYPPYFPKNQKEQEKRMSRIPTQQREDRPS